MGIRQSTIDPEIVRDLLRHTSYVEEEIEERYRNFLRTYPRGYLTIEEFEVEFQRKFPNGESSDYAEHIIRVFDANRDGRLDFREYLTYVYLTSSRARIDQKIKFAFELFDVDGNKLILWEEMQEVLKSVYKAMGRLEEPEDEAGVNNRISHVFQFLDRNRDGQLTFEEFEDSIKIAPNLCKNLRSDPLTFCIYE